MLNGRCRLHGGLSPKGKDHWNHRHGRCTKEFRKNAVDESAYLKFIEKLAIELGMIVVKN